MAEVRKREKRKEYNIAKNTNKNKKKDTKKEVKQTPKKTTKKVEEKKSLWVRFRIFCHGVKMEFKKVHWPTKKDMVKYSIATIVFIVFFSVFFYGIDVIFALVKSLFN